LYFARQLHMQAWYKIFSSCQLRKTIGSLEEIDRMASMERDSVCKPLSYFVSKNVIKNKKIL